jgi:photosystem II stability/assembly factor-like uncharacterized protein
MIIKTLSVIAIVLAASVFSLAQWTAFDAGTDASFRGLDVESEEIVWASGTGGTVIRTIDGGKTWSVFKVPGAEELDFRDIEGFGAKTAYVLSIGNGEASRIYKTSDGGETWELQFKNSIENAFFDSIAFWDEKNGFAQSDPVDGKYVFFRTMDGKTWNRVSAGESPAASEGEAAFAASGTCIVTQGKYGLFLITGGTDARVLYSPDRGKSWRSSETPMIKGGAGTGIFGFAAKGKRVIIVGGDYTKPEKSEGNVAFSNDGGKTWEMPADVSFGYRSGAAFVTKNTAVAVGTSGSDISFDGGSSWKKIDSENYNVVAARGMSSVWAAGPRGRIAKLSVPKK